MGIFSKIIGSVVSHGGNLVAKLSAAGIHGPAGLQAAMEIIRAYQGLAAAAGSQAVTVDALSAKLQSYVWAPLVRPIEPFVLGLLQEWMPISVHMVAVATPPTT